MSENYNVWGYCECRGESIPPKQALVVIERKAAELGGVWRECFVEHTPLGKNIPHNRRPIFRRLSRLVDSGDHLVVWQLEHLDANPFTLVKALRFLARRHVSVHALDFQGGELDLDQNWLPFFVAVMTSLIGMFTAHRGDSVRRALRARSQAGGSVGRFPALGKRRINVEGENFDVWDYRELHIIGEIVVRRRRGESFRAIGRDLYERRVKTGAGRLWVKPKGRKKTLDISRVRRAYTKWPKIHADFLASASAQPDEERAIGV
jgi:DNA invertase Pin-like site-specific DNA recombinase